MTFHWLSCCFSGHFYQPPFLRCPWNTGASQQVGLSVLFPPYMLLQNDLFEFILNRRWNVSALCALKTKSLPGSWPAYPTSCGTSQRCPTASKPTGPKLSSSSSHKPVLPEVCSISEKGTTNVPPAKAKPRTHWCLRFLPSPALHLVTHQVLLFLWWATVHGVTKSRTQLRDYHTHTKSWWFCLLACLQSVHISPLLLSQLWVTSPILWPPRRQQQLHPLHPAPCSLSSSPASHSRLQSSTPKPYVRSCSSWNFWIAQSRLTPFPCPHCFQDKVSTLKQRQRAFNDLTLSLLQLHLAPLSASPHNSTRCGSPVPWAGQTPPLSSQLHSILCSGHSSSTTPRG